MLLCDRPKTKMYQGRFYCRCCVRVSFASAFLSRMGKRKAHLAKLAEDRKRRKVDADPDFVPEPEADEPGPSTTMEEEEVW